MTLKKELERDSKLKLKHILNDERSYGDTNFTGSPNKKTEILKLLGKKKVSIQLGYRLAYLQKAQFITASILLLRRPPYINYVVNNSPRSCATHQL